MKKKIFIVAAVLFSYQLHAQKAHSQISTIDSTKSLDEVIVTATKTAIKQSQTGKVVSVIDQQTLRLQAGKNLTEILNYQAGIFINGANNTQGTNQDVYFRGASTGNVLILIDGVPVGDPSQINNSFDLNNIATSQVEKIEILKGAQSTLWGSDAVAGVINIITKKGGNKKIATTAGISFGSYNTIKANVGINGKINGFNYNVTYNHTKSKGFSSANDSTGNNNFDNDGFTQNNIQANIGYAITPKLTATALLNYGRYTADLDAGAFKDDIDYTTASTNLVNTIGLAYTFKKGTVHLSNTINNSTRNIFDDTSSIITNGSLYKADYKGNSMVTELYGNVALTKKLSVVAGVQRLAQNTTQTYSGYSRDYLFAYAGKLAKDSAATTNFSVYASALLLNVKRVNVEVGFRLNNHSLYGNNTTFTFNPSYNIDEDTRVFVNISSAYKIPSLYQLYGEYGNRNLQPESSNNYEIGVQSFSNNKKNSLRLVAFKRDINNLIIFNTDAITYVSQYANGNKQNDYGFEIESNIAIGKIGTWVNNAAYVDGELSANNEKVRNLYRRPNFTFNSSLTLQPAKGLTVTPSFRFVGNRLKGEYDPGSAIMSQYYTVDLYAGYTFKKQLNIFIDARNITNQKFMDIVGYNSRMSNITIGLNANF